MHTPLFKYMAVAFILLVGVGQAPAAPSSSPQTGVGTMSVIVELDDAAAFDPSLVQARNVQRLSRLKMVTLEIPPSRLSALMQLPGVQRVLPDGEVRRSSVLPAAPASVAATDDLAVAVLDGPDSAAPCRPASRIEVHKTRVTETGRRASEDRCVEVVPGAAVHELQVFDHKGRARLSTLLRALEWVAEQAPERRIGVVALPLAEPLDLQPPQDPLVLAVSRLWATGIAVVQPAHHQETQRIGLVTASR